MVDPVSSRTEIEELIHGHREWLLVYSTGRSFPVLDDEIEIVERGNRLILGLPDNAGFKYWRIEEFEAGEKELIFRIVSGEDAEKIRLIERTAAQELVDAVEMARLEKADEIAKFVPRSYRGAKLARVSLNKENGRTAHILAAIPGQGKKAFLADVTGKITPENMLTIAMLWLIKLERRKKDPIDQVRIIAEKRPARALQRLHALLTEKWKDGVRIAEIDRKPDEPILRNLPALTIDDLWREKSKKPTLPVAFRMTQIARDLSALSPGNTDVIFSRQGETIRYLGLPFARTRTVAAKTRGWLGSGRNLSILAWDGWNNAVETVKELEAHRQPAPPTKRHEFYTQAPEAWLESILRRDIKRLDANLILSPIYNQFRTSADKIDLLALREDGRLVIIELKTSIDREMIFQAADYWRKIELQRRAGHLQEARLFGDRQIRGRPALIYLAAPAFTYHRDLDLFARSLSPELEIYRFDLHREWRRKIKVLRQIRLGTPVN